MSGLEVRGLSAGYGKAEVLHRLDLNVEKGAIVTVIGPNGAGKTTLLSALMGLLPSQGSIRYGSQELSELPTEERVPRLCLVPEKRELFGDLSVEDNLVLGAFRRMRSGAHGFQDDMEAIYLRFPHLKERRKQLAATLSGGERQMLALGRALMAKPLLLMLDEPSLGLAPDHRATDLSRHSRSQVDRGLHPVGGAECPRRPADRGLWVRARNGRARAGRTRVRSRREPARGRDLSRACDPSWFGRIPLIKGPDTQTRQVSRAMLQHPRPETPVTHIQACLHYATGVQ